MTTRIDDERLPGVVAPVSRHRVLRRRAAIAAIIPAAVGILAAPYAAADTNASLRAGVEGLRGTACGPLIANPAIDQAAAKINDTTDSYINHTARAIPETDALPVLKDVGYDGTKAVILSGAATTEANAVKAILLQGFAKIPDCSYSAYGVSASYNAKKDMILTTVVLAG